MMSANKTEKATFGAGCYWGSQPAFHQLAGVVATVVGFMDDIEVVQVEYDPALISYDGLLDVFWGSHDASVGEGGERSALFVDGNDQEGKARQSKASAGSVSTLKINTQIRKTSAFKRALQHDQHYHEKRGK